MFAYSFIIIFIITLNSIIYSSVIDTNCSPHISSYIIIYILIRIFCCFLISFTIYKSTSSVVSSIIGGEFLLLYEHIVLNGGYFLIVEQDALAFKGIIISTIFLIPMAAAISYLGALFSRRKMAMRK